jgi:hypothetical protein
MIYQAATLAKLGQIRGELDVAFQRAEQRLHDSAFPFSNVDLNGAQETWPKRNAENERIKHRCLAYLKEVTRLDRLARTTRDLLNTLAVVANRGAGFRSLADAWADTTTPHGRLMLTVLGGLAEFERELIRARTGEGRERAKARGVRLGRKPKLTPHQIREAIRRRDDNEETVREIARSYNVSHSTISRLKTG